MGEIGNLRNVPLGNEPAEIDRDVFRDGTIISLVLAPIMHVESLFELCISFKDSSTLFLLLDDGSHAQFLPRSRDFSLEAQCSNVEASKDYSVSFVGQIAKAHIGVLLFFGSGCSSALIISGAAAPTTLFGRQTRCTTNLVFKAGNDVAFEVGRTPLTTKR